MAEINLEELVLYDRAGVLAIKKPAGFETVSKTGGACLSRELLDQLKASELYPAHRLDRDTTGVQLFARNKQVLAKLEDAFRYRTTDKKYLAICSGIPFNPEGSIRRNLSQWGGGRRPVQVVKGNGGLEAQTDYQLLARNKDFPASLILFHPLQGRTHQIRVHAMAFGRPILGDDQYGNRPENAQIKQQFGVARQTLHALKLSIPEPESGQLLCLHAPLPEDMATVCDGLFPEWKQFLYI